MKTAAQISNLADQLRTISTRLVGQEALRADAIARIKNDTRLSDSAKQEELIRVSGLEVLTALRAQINILKSDLDAGAKEWANLGMVLRAAALPMGATPTDAATMGLLRDEAGALENDPAALQAALEDAAVGKDWSRLYSLALGRLDENGTPLGNFQGVIRGIRLDCCDLPGQLLVMESLCAGEVACLQANAAWQHATAQSGLTTVALLANAPAKLAKAKFDRSQRLLMTPAEALAKKENERAEPGDRYVMVESPNASVYCIFDNFDGTTRMVDAESGPAYMAKLNALNRIPSVASSLAMASPVDSDPGTIPGGH